MTPTVAIKPTLIELKGMVADDAFAQYLAKDSGLLAKFGDAATIKTVLMNWSDGDAANGEFAAIPVKELNGALYLFVSSTTDTSGLNATKLSGKQKITLSVPESHNSILGFLGGEVERHPTRYYSNVNASTRPNALWEKLKLCAR